MRYNLTEAENLHVQAVKYGLSGVETLRDPAAVEFIEKNAKYVTNLDI